MVLKTRVGKAELAVMRLLALSPMLALSLPVQAQVIHPLLMRLLMMQVLLTVKAGQIVVEKNGHPAYAAVEPRSCRMAAMTVREGRKGGDANQWLPIVG